MVKTINIMIVAGGTGGHIFPAVALMEYIIMQQNINPNISINIFWLGSKHGMEYNIFQMLQLANTQFIHIDSPKISLMNIITGKLILAWIRSIYAIIKYKPNKMITFGGYPSFAPGISAWMMHVPLIVHEQNATTGLVNRILSKISTINLFAYPDNLSIINHLKNHANPTNNNNNNKKDNNIYYKKHDIHCKKKHKYLKYIVVGNPLRQYILQKAINNNSNSSNNKSNISSQITTQASCQHDQLKCYIPHQDNTQIHNQKIINTDNSIKILIVGGSTGSSFFNQFFPKLFLEYHQILSNVVSVLHQTGKGKNIDTNIVLNNKIGSINYKSCEFIENIVDIYSMVDLVICRSGAMTVSEIAAMAKLAIFIPLPNAKDNHQMHNTHILLANNACMVFEQKQLQLNTSSSNDLVKYISKLDKNTCYNIGQIAKRSFFYPEAANSIYNITIG